MCAVHEDTIGIDSSSLWWRCSRSRVCNLKDQSCNLLDRNRLEADCNCCSLELTVDISDSGRGIGVRLGVS